MIPVPDQVISSIADLYKINRRQLLNFGGGDESSDGVVYSYTENRIRKLLKILAIPVEDQKEGLFCFEERIKFFSYLAENGTDVVIPLLSPNGNLYETAIDSNYVWIGYSMNLISGRSKPEKVWDPDFFRKWGEIIGKCHHLSKEYPSWQSSKEPISGHEFLTWNSEWEGFYEWCQDVDVQSKWVEIKQQLDTLPVSRDAFGFIHNDPHLWNLLADGDKITLIDFDVANHHWFINDIAIACQSIMIFFSGGLFTPIHHVEKLQQFLDLFLEGYQRENILSKEWLDRIDLFLAYRRILMFIVRNQWLRSRPKLYESMKCLILSDTEIIGNWSR